MKLYQQIPVYFQIRLYLSRKGNVKQKKGRPVHRDLQINECVQLSSDISKLIIETKYNEKIYTA